jgi:ERCC4-type nuclease
MIIKIDVREQELYSHIERLISTIQTFKNIKVEKEQLAIGDIIILDTLTNKEKIIIERKSVTDLISSIKDGRYKEQSYRLNGLDICNHNIIYLIEGDINKLSCFKNNKTDKMMAYSAIFSLNYSKGFSVIRTFSIEETAIFICSSYNKLIKEETIPFYHNAKNNDTQYNEEKNKNNETDEKEINNKNNEEEQIYENNDKIQNAEEKDYVHVIKKVKKENITQDNIGEIMLCQIPGISSVTAIAIMNKFKTLTTLIKELENDVNCLKDISYVNSKSQTRKINKTSINNIIKFLLQK